MQQEGTPGTGALRGRQKAREMSKWVNKDVAPKTTDSGAAENSIASGPVACTIGAVQPMSLRAQTMPTPSSYITLDAGRKEGDLFYIKRALRHFLALLLHDLILHNVSSLTGMGFTY